MANIVQLVRALNCDFKSREFKSHYSPKYICKDNEL